MSTRSQPRPMAYGSALLVAGLALLVRVVLDPAMGLPASLVIAEFAVVLGTWLGGPAPGAAALLLFLVGDGLSRFGLGWRLEDPSRFVGPALLVVASAGTIALVESLRRARDAVEARRRGLEAEASARADREAALREETRRVTEMLEHADKTVRRYRVTWEYADRRCREAERLAELADECHAPLDVERMLHPIAAAVRDLGGADAVRIALREPGGTAFRVHYALGEGLDALPSDLIDPESAAVAAVLAGGQPWRGGPSTGASGEGSPEGASGPAERPMMIVPLRIRNSIEGLLVAARDAPHTFSQHDEAVALRIARVAGIAMQNAGLLAGEQSARAAAEASSRAKDEFLAMLGHELRNPLGAITHAVAGFDRLATQWGALQRIMARQTGHLGRLLDDLLDVSRVTMGKIVLHRESVDLHRLADETLRALKSEGRNHRHTITLSGEPTWAYGDATRLEQVVRNLLDNALKYTPEGGHIFVDVRAEADAAVLRVRDTGLGIPPEVLPHVFDLFVQQPRSPDRVPGGLGLGLTLVRRLVELHGGTVAAASAGPDQGSEFTIRVPRAAPAEPPAAGADHPAARVPAPRRCRVAVVEDNVDTRDALQMVLRMEGYDVETAADGRAGLDLIVRAQPGVAFIDIGLPGLDGYEVARRVRSARGGTKLHLVALTGYGQPYDRARALEAGFDEHLVKPVDIEVLLRVLARAA
jgi:signal transduction histidine kinase